MFFVDRNMVDPESFMNFGAENWAKCYPGVKGGYIVLVDGPVDEAIRIFKVAS